MKKIILLSLVGVSIYAMPMNNAKELFINKCASCHVLKKPTDTSNLVAPPAKGVMFHLGEALGSNEKIKNHIVDFVINPTKEKAICKSVKKFGVMPSQKGNVSSDELKLIANWMVNNLKMNKKQHKKMKNKETSKKNKKPFLIQNGLPHLTMLVKKHWDDNNLNLTKIQKDKLMKIRFDTLNGAKTLAKKIFPLEKLVAKGSSQGKTVNDLKKYVLEIADLRAKATIVHLNCIYNTKQVLTEQQLQYLY